MFAARHFQLEVVADGVWAAVHPIDPPRPDGWAISNAGIIDLGGRTLVVDACMTTAAAAELRAAAESLTGRGPDLVAFTHDHNDHVWGAGALGPALVVASRRTRDALLAEAGESIASYREAAPSRLAAMEDAAASDDPERRREAAFLLPYWNGVVATLPGLQIRLPELVFEERLELRGRGRRAELVDLGVAHTAGDVAVVLPDDGVAFTGDVLFAGCHPYLADGDLAGLRAAWRTIKGMGTVRLVPGHGPVVGPEAIDVLDGYLAVLEAAAGASSPGSAPPVPEAYRDWSLPRFWPANVEFVRAGG